MSILNFFVQYSVKGLGVFTVQTPGLRRQNNTTEIVTDERRMSHEGEKEPRSKMLLVMYFLRLLKYIGLNRAADDGGGVAAILQQWRRKLNFTMTTTCRERSGYKRHPISSAIRSVYSAKASRRIGFGNPRRVMRQKTDSTLSRCGA